MTNEEQIKKWKKQLEEYDKKRVAELNEIRSTPSVPISSRNKDADTSNFFGGLLGGLLPGAGIADVAIKNIRKDQTLQQEAKKQGIDLNNLYTTQENLNMFGADVGRTVEATGAGISSALSNLGKGTLIAARNMGVLNSVVDKAVTDLRAGTENAQIEELKSKAKEKGIDTITLDEYLNKAKNTKTSLELINDFSANTFDKWSNEANQRIVELQGETENDFAKKAIGFMPNLSQQAVTIGASLINPVLGTSVATGQAMGSYYNDAKSRGMTDEQANDFSQIMGIVEGATEMIGVDKLIKAGKGAKALAKGGLSSARKELSKEVITSTFGNLLSGAMDNFMQEAITEPIQEGVADWIGGKGNWENIDQRMLEAGINGAITSLITGGANIGVQSAVGVASKTRNGQTATQQEVNQGLVDTLSEIDKLSKEEKQEFIDKYVTPGIQTAQDVVKNEQNQVPTEPNRAVPMQTSENAQQQVQEQEQQVIPNQDENALNQNVEPQNLVESAERSGIDVKDEKTRKNLETIQKFNENRGIKATFDADAFKGHDNVNSFFRTDENGNREIVFNPNTMTDKTIEQLAVHEIYHDMVAGGSAEELTDFVVQKMSNNPEYQEYVRALQDVYEEQDSDIIKEEAVAHYLEKNLGTNEFISELQERGDRTTIQRIIDTIKDMITKAKNTLTGKGDLNYLLDLQRKYEQAYNGEFNGAQEQTKLSKQVNAQDTTRYSKETPTTDNQGRTLTKEQQDYFKDSKVRDENGNLETFYHGANQQFNTFNSTRKPIYGNKNVNFFTNNENVAKSYGGEVYETYINSKSPYILNGDTDGTTLEYSKTGKEELTQNSDIIKAIRQKLDENGSRYYKKSVSKISENILDNNKNILSSEEIQYLTEHPLSLAYLSVKAKDGFTPYSKSVNTNDLVNAVLNINEKTNNKYDGVIFKSIQDAGQNFDNNAFAKNDVIATFEPNQIKNVDNTNPTENVDIRYSKEAPTKDNQGRELSKGQQERLKNTKAVDEDGNVLELYHFTPSGDFTIFDKTRANPESDMGAGFYFTNSEIDGQQNYQDENGADIRNRIDRLAEQIENEEDITYEEARKKAEQQVLQGGSSFNVYLDIENPAYIGGENETTLFSQDDIKNYAEENDLGYDFENDENAYENALADYVEDITNDFYDTYSYDEVQQIQRAIYDVLWENDLEGITAQQLKEKLNDVNTLELYDDNGKLMGNELARQIIENMGYDGIIDSTVSSKFNMNLDPDTTHYIVFNPEQIKNVTNLNPTDNPDINLSKQGQGKSQKIIDQFLENTKVNEGTGTAIKDLARVQEETTEPVRQVAPSEAPAQVPQVNKVKQRQVENTQPTTQETITQQTEPVVSGEKGQRKTLGKEAQNQNLPQEFRDVADKLYKTNLYTKKKNSQLKTQAQDRISKVGADNLLTDLTEKTNNSPRLSAEDMVASIELYNHYVQKGDIQKSETALQNIAMSGTEIAQALQAMSIMNHLTPQGQAIWIQRSADKLNKSMLAKKKATLKTIDGQQRVIDKNGKDITNKTPLFKFTQEMQQKLLNSTKDNMYDVIDDIYKEMGQQVPKSHMEQFDEWRFFSMLGNPKTHIRNSTGNVTMEGLRQVKNKLAGAIEDAYYSVTGKDGERNHTLRFADKKTKEFAKQDVKNRDVQTMLGVTEDKYNPQSRLKQNQRTFKSNLFENSVGKLFKGNTGLLSKEDVNLFGIAGLEPAYRRSLTEYITANRLDVDAMTDKQLQRAREYAVTEAKEATFHTHNKIASMLNTLENKNLATKILVGGTVPFKQTPMNVAIQGFEYSPAGLLKTLTYDTAQLKKGNINANQYINKISKGLTGTGIALLGYALTSAGVLKASSGGDDKDDYEKSLGKQSYAIQIGDNTYSLDWLAPAGIPLFVGSELYQISKADAEEKKGGNVNQNEIAQSAENLFNAMTTAMNPMTEMTMLSGLTSVLKSYANDPAQALGNIVINTGKSYVTQSVPTALGQIARSTDDKERSTSSTESNVFTKAIDSTKNQIMSKVPGLRQMLPVATDVWGNEVEGKNYLENAILPANRKEVKSDKVDKAITKLYDETGESAVIPDTYIQKTLTLDKEKYRLTNEEYAQLKQQYGQSSHDLLEALTQSSDYDKLTNEQKVKAVKEVYSYVKASLKHTYADQNDIDVEDSKVYQKVQDVIRNGGDAKDYFKYVGLTNGMDKDAEQINALENSNIRNKGAIYESTVGKDDDDYKIMKNAGVNDKAYLDYKQQKFESDKDAYGKTISGSKKDKFYDYMDNANMTYEQKLLLTGMNYTLLPGERDTLANYIESLPISASEKTDIYRHLKGAKVYNNGEIYY